MQLKNQGAGLPDGGLFSARQFQRQASDLPAEPQNPERGVIETKGTGDDAWVTALSVVSWVKSDLDGHHLTQRQLGSSLAVFVSIAHQLFLLQGFKNFAEIVYGAEKFF